LNQRPIFRSFVCLSSRLKKSRSRFDKFNHVKYTKTLSVRNRRATNRLLFFAPNAPNAHKASSIASIFRARRTLLNASMRGPRKARHAIFVAPIAPHNRASGARAHHACRAIFRSPNRTRKSVPKRMPARGRNSGDAPDRGDPTAPPLRRVGAHCAAIMAARDARA
jgi:hypothetical protein